VEKYRNSPQLLTEGECVYPSQNINNIFKSLISVLKDHRKETGRNFHA